MTQAGQVTPEMVAALRQLIDEPDTDTFTDQDLQNALVSNGLDPNITAFYIWTQKAASLSSLVDITEGGSSRKNSQAFANAQKMADHYKGFLPDTTVTPGRRSRTRAIERA